MRRPALPRRVAASLLAGVLGAGALSLGAHLAAPATAPAPTTDVRLAAAANPVTPGDFTGYAFDQCNTVTQKAMQAWRRSSPFRGVGVYISGDSRACKTQANLTPDWVRNQLAAGWRLLPITLGPQASCSTRYPKYGARVDPTINASTANGYAAARTQGTAEAREAVAAATRLGIVPGSTLFYDLEAFDTRRSTACTQSALWFTHAWTVELHRLGYASGFYSSAASGIRMLDDQRVRAGNPFTLPDQIWIADWDGRANTTSTYVRADGWASSRVKQYRGGHNETHGGVTINIDSNYLSLRTPRLPGTPAPAPAPTPTPAPVTGPRHTGTVMADARCTPGTINQPAYRRTGSKAASTAIVPLQCLLKQRRLYPYEVTGAWNGQTTAALQKFQRSVSLPVRTFASRSDWVALHVRGTGRSALKAGSTGADVTRVQRALNAAGPARLRVSGTYDAPSAAALGAYQRKLGLKATGRPDAATWKALERGRW